MSTPDFTRPHPTVSINGFPIRFRMENLNGRTILWVPQRISRNSQSKGWRILINHAAGQLKLWEPDGGREPVESLQGAWERMVIELNQLTTSVTNTRRLRIRGRKRNPAMDTGVDGVLIKRRKSRGGQSKTVGVGLFQRIVTDDGTIKSKGVETFCISESKFLEDPNQAQRRFHRALCVATAIRRKYLDAVAAGRTPNSPVTTEDLVVTDVPSSPARALDLFDIFDSFDTH